MKLTRRQEDFLRKMFEIYPNLDEPIHYTELAERLEESKYTAYYMLRLLEKKGYIDSYYKARGKGPGRSIVLYQPTDKARQIFETLSEGASAEWDTIQGNALKSLKDENVEDKALADTILTRNPSSLQDDADYCASLISALAIRVRTRARHHILSHYLSPILHLLGTNGSRGLKLLPSFLLGLSASEEDEPDFMLRLMEGVSRYEQMVDSMDLTARNQLSKALKGILAPIDAT